jgi:hypothetical protein
MCLPGTESIVDIHIRILSKLFGKHIGTGIFGFFALEPAGIGQINEIHLAGF